MWNSTGFIVAAEIYIHFFITSAFAWSYDSPRDKGDDALPVKIISTPEVATGRSTPRALETTSRSVVMEKTQWLWGIMVTAAWPAEWTLR